MCIKPEKYLIRVTAKNKIWKKDNPKALKNTFQATRFKVEGSFKDLYRNVTTFQEKMEFKDFSRTPLKVKTVQTLFLSDRTSFSVQRQFYEGT